MTVNPEDDRLLKLPEAAAIFGVQPATIRDWIKEGKLKGVKIGKGYYWRVPLSAVRELATKMYGDSNDSA